MSDLKDKKCVPCEGFVEPLTPAEYEPLLAQVPDWTVADQKQISREFSFKNFTEALEFVNKVGEVAEAENHHPDILLHGYKHVRITLMTHAIKGLSENDFVEAAKIDTMFQNIT